MKNKLAPLFCVFSLIMLFSQAYSQADSLSVKPLIIPDSSTTSYEWTSKSPLSPELQQQREDNRAEVENMKRRFRQFHQQSSTKDLEEQKATEDQGFLWPEAEGSFIDKEQIQNTTTPSTTNTEEVRILINRSFQQEAISAPSDTPPANSPVKGYDFENNQPISPKPSQPTSTETDWEKEAFQSNNNTAVDWQLNIGENRNPITPSRRLTTGELINMELHFEEKSSLLTPAIKRDLNEWMALFHQYPGIKIEVRAHTHKGVAYTEALELTTQRARTIVDYFSTAGMAILQLNFKGYGNLSPLFSSSDEKNQQKNERIELIILELPKR